MPRTSAKSSSTAISSGSGFDRLNGDEEGSVRLLEKVLDSRLVGVPVEYALATVAKVAPVLPVSSLPNGVERNRSEGTSAFSLAVTSRSAS